MSDSNTHASSGEVHETDENAVHERLLVSGNTVASLLSISVSSLYKLQSTNQIPAPIRLGGMVRWNVEELRHWVNCGCPTLYLWDFMRKRYGFTDAPPDRSQRNVQKHKTRAHSVAAKSATPEPAQDHAGGSNGPALC